MADIFIYFSNLKSGKSTISNEYRAYMAVPGSLKDACDV